MTRNAFTVDVEGFVESNRESFAIPDGLGDERTERYELERNMDALLALLDETRTRATMFFVGTVARRLPELVSRAASLGHEIASHGPEHRRIFGLERASFRGALADHKAHLEDVSGGSVVGFRAPDFSITERSLWALDDLRETGFLYDSSVYPIGMHDVYGIKGAERSIFTWPNGLVEFPLATAEIGGRRIPFGGGGYFRLYPLALTRWLIARENRAGRPVAFFIHPYEAGPEIPKIPGLPAVRRFRHYFRASQGPRRLRPLLERLEFAPAADVLAEAGALGGSPVPARRDG